MIRLAPHDVSMGMVFALGAEARTAATWQQATGALGHVAGPGEAGAAAAARYLVANGARGLVSWGTSGALTEKLETGQLLLLASTGRLGEGRTTACESWLHASAAALSALHPKIIDACTVRAPLTGAVAKRLLGERSGCAAVDMESAAVADVAAAAGLPFLGVRAVVDPVSLEIPSSAIAGLGIDGTSTPFRVLAALCRRPGELPSVIKLGRHFQQALKSLTQAASLLAAAGVSLSPRAPAG